jgi:GNAT superfamily N-acetyltransferase
MAAFQITEALSAPEIAAVAALFDAYAASLPIELGYQDFATERATLPGKYVRPGGVLLLARDAAGSPLGCVALRALGGGRAEIKRLYVAPAARGLGLGRALLAGVTQAAIELGHGALCLDTLPFMAEAQARYMRAGFLPIPPYGESPVPGTAFLGKELP